MKGHLALLLFFIGTTLFAQEVNDHLTATIIGSGSPKFNTQRSGPSVLISYKNTQILVDMGNGTQANLNQINTKIKDLDGLLFTHHHLDHNEEFAPLFIQSLLGGNQTIIAGPEQTTSIIDNILDIYEEDIDYRLSKSERSLSDVTSNFTAKNLTGNGTFTIGDIKISYTPVNHTIATTAYRFDVGNESIVISGDLTYSKSLPILAKNVDYLIMDSGGAIAKDSKASSKKKNKKNNHGTQHKAHVNLAESSQMAEEANAKHLVLTHFNFTTIDETATTAQIRENYPGVVIYAEDLMLLPITQNTTSNTILNQEVTKTKQVEANQDNTAPSFDKMLEKMDTNADGKLSKSEVKGKLKDNFNNRDKNKDGYITKDELDRRNR
ncbi:MBL fold metallo-hydrolase [Olleya sp. Bg11-27]|uniref:MBL fold metallo-hydrolase n=1 Tax=Olleya sp. Bg11-27 TaxID=2058135 RepID=UPI000C30D2C4|nr:MBL fold metallo-hydrolase [Olleya sp. Bg11-27]AUC75516.1 MBL fold metallo-hydrolase [Olleya sp. Bg11-27]